MENSFKIEIISPEKIIFSEETKMVTLPSYEGDMSILKNKHVFRGIITIYSIMNKQKLFCYNPYPD